MEKCPSQMPHHFHDINAAQREADARNYGKEGHKVRGRWHGRNCPFCPGAVVVPTSKKDMRMKNPRLRAKFERAAAARAAKAAA